MAKGDKYTCRTCGTEYIYCEKCEIRPVPHLSDGFCCPECKEIFNILSKNGCGFATADETLKALEIYNISEKKFKPSIQGHVDSLVSATTETKKIINDEAEAETKKKKW